MLRSNVVRPSDSVMALFRVEISPMYGGEHHTKAHAL
jgi:hypothetical protein